MKILALSSSRAGNSGYLEPAIPLIKEILGEAPLHIAFIPFAGVSGEESYYQKVKDALQVLPHHISMVDADNGYDLISACEAVMIGGGNTFKLLHDLYQANLIRLIAEKVANGAPYIGWSAGANILGPTIGTTNDMPIIQPRAFQALGLLPFQINPHYFNQSIDGFNGETRDQRLTEYLTMNPTRRIIGLPEGTAMMVKGDKPVFRGSEAGVLMYKNLHGSGIQKETIQDGWIYPY